MLRIGVDGVDDGILKNWLEMIEHYKPVEYYQAFI